ncbi:MAG: hypothetical protein E6K86_11555, partial [Thaumarchaeota archaeon]
MLTNNPMKDPDVARRALESSKIRFLKDPTHGWHRNVDRMKKWLHSHPSVSQRRLYEMLDQLGVPYEKEFKITLENRTESSKSY